MNWGEPSPAAGLIERASLMTLVGVRTPPLDSSAVFQVPSAHTTIRRLIRTPRLGLANSRSYRGEREREMGDPGSATGAHSSAPAEVETPACDIGSSGTLCAPLPLGRMVSTHGAAEARRVSLSFRPFSLSVLGKRPQLYPPGHLIPHF